MKTFDWVRYAAALVVAGGLSIPLSRANAEDQVGGNAASPGAAAGAAKKPASKDPATSAFALPKGVTLNAKQQAAYDQLKADKEPELRQAIDELQNDKSGATAQAAKKLRDLRAEIRKGINDIVYAPTSSPSTSRDSAGSSGSSTPGGSGYAAPYPVPYGGYYSYRPYGGYYPYPYYYPRRTDGRLTGQNGGKSTDRKLPPRPQASRPASGSSTSGGAKR